MRIQHNIMAMGAYRNYTNNVNALKKNLEKLSSGYKINRAGDDAAGLAISEKMRAQITGLETAQKNAKDGISLVQTAEGALTEVHDMLNRMVTLATQSANGTYDDTTDRVQLQKEVDQLKDEINRIADSANFNGIKLLDGSLSSEKTTIPGSALINLGTKEAARFIAAGGGTAAPVGMSKLSTVLHQDATTGGKSSFEIDLDGCGFDSVVSTAVGVSVAITVGGVKMTMAAVTGKTKVDGADLADALDNVGEVSIGGISYSVTAEGSKLKFEMTEASFAKATIAGSFSGNLGVTIGIGTANSGVMANGGDINYSTVNIKEGGKPAGVILANTVQQTGFASSDIKDKLTLQIGNEAYIFALTDETFDQATAVANTAQPDGITYKVVDVRDLVNPNTSGANSALKTGNDVLSNALTRLTVVAKDNDMFSVGLQADATNPKLTFQEKSTYSGDADLSHVTNSTGNALEDQFKLYKNAGFNVTTPTVSKEGKSLTLQIGDTADTFNQLEVNVKDCHVASLGLGSIDISKQDSALAAIDKIKAAINTVSDVRGTLGATQNRLDHTINNLSVMTENIQDAESTIRDTDVAAEMMEYTKNNILIQSAQAMLAQANQVPQGVLQLLQ